MSGNWPSVLLCLYLCRAGQSETDLAAPALTCIADYHESGPIDVTSVEGDPTARHCHHRAIYDFPLSEEWKAWMKVSGQGLDKDDMGEFIEAQAKDIMDPTPAVLKGEQHDNNQPWENRLVETAPDRRPLWSARATTGDVT
ncbi:DUF2303 family protein [Tritonibacter mobilis]|uniref:DUF2303 family protein n=1 Tax=Tritonibacter mobilis TaxID=379347 RepID=UPI000806A3AA|nr:DUF2303 family protein [Tritonibacter mobilis]